MPDFEEVYRLYFADVYNYILALSRDGTVAEEHLAGCGSCRQQLTAMDATLPEGEEKRLKTPRRRGKWKS